MTTTFVKTLKRCVAVLLFAPALAKAELFGFGPIDLAGPSAFISSAMVVTVTLAAIKQRRGTEQPDG